MSPKANTTAPNPAPSNVPASATAAPVALPAPIVSAGSFVMAPATIAYLDALANIAMTVIWAALGNPGAIPPFRIWPGLPPRGALGSTSGADAQTFGVAPMARTLGLRKTKVPGQKTHHVETSKTAEKDTINVSDRWTIILNPLRYARHVDRDRGESRGTHALLTDVVKGLLFASAGFAPAFPGAGTRADFKALIDVIKRGPLGATFEPAKLPLMDRTVNPPVQKRDKSDALMFRDNWNDLITPESIAKVITHAILDAGLPDTPPAELRADFLAFMNGDRRPQTNPYAQAEATVNGQKVMVRLQYSALRDLLATLPEGSEDVDTFNLGPVRFNRADIDRAKAKLTPAEAAAKREADKRAAENGEAIEPAGRVDGALTAAPPAPRRAPARTRATSQTT
jgi:hypothetical protein